MNIVEIFQFVTNPIVGFTFSSAVLAVCLAFDKESVL